VYANLDFLEITLSIANKVLVKSPCLDSLAWSLRGKLLDDACLGGAIWWRRLEHTACCLARVRDFNTHAVRTPAALRFLVALESLVRAVSVAARYELKIGERGSKRPRVRHFLVEHERFLLDPKAIFGGHGFRLFGL